MAANGTDVFDQIANQEQEPSRSNSPLPIAIDDGNYCIYSV